MFNVKMVLDSVSIVGKRLITVECEYPRFIHAELMTHRAFERNAGSSRAKPLSFMINMVETDPVVPIKWGAEQKGMKTGDSIPESLIPEAIETWLWARDQAVIAATRLGSLGVHKSLCNRVLEPFSWIKVVITATEWNNFFKQRDHGDAEIHFQLLAKEIRKLIKESTPKYTDWHLPYIQDDDRAIAEIHYLKYVSVARCAYVSYFKPGASTKDISYDYSKALELTQGSGFGHWSPFGHVAQASIDRTHRSGPFIGWSQFRKEFPFENMEGCDP